MRNIGVSNSYFYEHNIEAASFNIILGLRFREEVDIPVMQDAATEAIRLYPEMGFRPVLDGNGRIVAGDLNTGKVCFIQRDDKIHYLGTDDTNGYLFYFLCEGRDITLVAFHGMSDAKGITEYIMTMLYFYLEKKGIHSCDEEFVASIRTTEKDLEGLDEEDMYDPYRKYADMSAAPFVPQLPKAFQIPETSFPPEENHIHEYMISVSTSAFLKKTKELGVSAAPLLHLIVCDAVDEAFDMGDETYVGMLPVDLRRFFGSKTLVNCSDSIFIPQTAADRKESIQTRCKKIKETMLSQLDADRFAAMLAGKVKSSDAFDWSAKVKALVGASAGLPFTLGVSYPGATSFGAGPDELLEHAVFSGWSRVTMTSTSTFGDVMLIHFSMRTDDDRLLQCLKDSLESKGLAAEIHDRGYYQRAQISKDKLDKA